MGVEQEATWLGLLGKAGIPDSRIVRIHMSHGQNKRRPI